MTDYTEINEKYQKLIDENGLGELFKYTGDADVWEIKQGYPSVAFSIHNKPRSVEWLIRTAFDCGRRQGNDEQLKRTMLRIEGLISPNYNELINP